MFNYFHGKGKLKLIIKYGFYLLSIDFYTGKHFN